MRRAFCTSPNEDFGKIYLTILPNDFIQKLFEYRVEQGGVFHHRGMTVIVCLDD
jgi:hypothetical protein